MVPKVGNIAHYRGRYYYSGRALIWFRWAVVGFSWTICSVGEIWWHFIKKNFFCSYIGTLLFKMILLITNCYSSITVDHRWTICISLEKVDCQVFVMASRSFLDPYGTTSVLLRQFFRYCCRAKTWQKRVFFTLNVYFRRVLLIFKLKGPSLNIIVVYLSINYNEKTVYEANLSFSSALSWKKLKEVCYLFLSHPRNFY